MMKRTFLLLFVCLLGLSSVSQAEALIKDVKNTYQQLIAPSVETIKEQPNVNFIGKERYGTPVPSMLDDDRFDYHMFTPNEGEALIDSLEKESQSLNSFLRTKISPEMWLKATNKEVFECTSQRSEFLAGKFMASIFDSNIRFFSLREVNAFPKELREWNNVKKRGVRINKVGYKHQILGNSFGPVDS